MLPLAHDGRGIFFLNPLLPILLFARCTLCWILTDFWHDPRKTTSLQQRSKQFFFSSIIFFVVHTNIFFFLQIMLPEAVAIVMAPRDSSRQVSFFLIMNCSLFCSRMSDFITPRAEPMASLGWQLQVECRSSDSASIAGFIRMTHLQMVGPFTSPVQMFTWTLTWNLMSLIFDDLNCSIECVYAFANATVHTRSIYNYWLSIDLIIFFSHCGDYFSLS